MSVPARTVLPVKERSLPNPSAWLRRYRWPEISQIRVLTWLKTKNFPPSPPPSPLIKIQMATQLHLLWESEGSKFIVVKDINCTYARVKSQIIYTEYLPLLRELDQKCELFSERLSSECHSNTQVLQKFCSFTCLVQVLPEDSLQSHCTQPVLTSQCFQLRLTAIPDILRGERYLFIQKVKFRNCWSKKSLLSDCKEHILDSSSTSKNTRVY